MLKESFVLHAQNKIIITHGWSERWGENIFSKNKNR